MPNAKQPSMLSSTVVKIVLVVTSLMLVIAFLFHTTSKVLNMQVQHDVERFANPNEPPIRDYTTRELRMFENDRRTTSDSIYDTYYANVYHKLFDQHKFKLVEFECYDFEYRAKLGEYGRRAVILDLGCGTGVHLKCMAEDNRRATLYGMDTSKAMLDLAQKKLKKYKDRVRLIQGDFNNPDAVYDKMFTHITCFYFSFYYSENPQRFFDNCYKWLKTRGHLCIHVVHPTKFNPVPHAANPIKGISLQSYMPKRKTDCKVYFKNFMYKSDFKYDAEDHKATLHESFIYPKKQFVRHHTHQLHMHHHETIIRIARKCGFRLRHITKLFEIGQDNEYLCYLQKQ